MFQIVVIHATGIAANVLPHDIEDYGTNQGVFNDEWIQVGGRIVHNGTHDIDTTTGGGIQGAHIGGEGGRVNVV